MLIDPSQGLDFNWVLVSWQSKKTYAGNEMDDKNYLKDSQITWGIPQTLVFFS